MLQICKSHIKTAFTLSANAVVQALQEKRSELELQIASIVSHSKESFYDLALLQTALYVTTTVINDQALLLFIIIIIIIRLTVQCSK